MIKKRLVLGLICVTSLVLVAGCTKSNKDSSTTSTTLSSNETQAVTSKSVVSTTSASTVANKATTSNASNTSIDWQDSSIVVEGKTYLFPFNYQDLVSVGWDFDRTKYSNMADPYLLNKGDKISSTIALTNANFDSTVTAGFINWNSAAVEIKQSQIWSLAIDNTRAKKPVSFVLAGGITSGSTLDEVKKAYGEPTKTYYASELKYYEYTYTNDKYTKSLRLTIYEDSSIGLKMFSYSDSTPK